MLARLISRALAWVIRIRVSCLDLLFFLRLCVVSIERHTVCGSNRRRLSEICAFICEQKPSQISTSLRQHPSASPRLRLQLISQQSPTNAVVVAQQIRCPKFKTQNPSPNPNPSPKPISKSSVWSMLEPWPNVQRIECSTRRLLTKGDRRVDRRSTFIMYEVSRLQEFPATSKNSKTQQTKKLRLKSQRPKTKRLQTYRRRRHW